MMFHVSREEGHSGSNSSGPEAGHKTELVSARQMKWSVTFLLVYFGLRLLFFALAISPSVPPDEVTHFGMSRIFSEVFFLPENSPATYQYGLVTNIPWLYYWTMGRLLAVNIFGVPDLLFLRLLNIPFAFATIFFVRRMLRLLTDDRLTQLLLIVAMTNTIMFSFLSAFVTYDNLVNLVAAMAVYYLLAFFRTRSGDLLAASFLCQLAGSLTKISFLPLVLVLNVLLLVHEFKGLLVLPKALPAYFKAAGWRRWGLALGIFLGLALNIQLFGGNYLSYGALNPDMSEVLSPDKAMQNRLEVRDRIFSLFKEGRISKEEALAMTSNINHPADRADTIYLIQNYEDQKQKGVPELGPLEYMPVWCRTVFGSVFGILAHISMLNQGPTTLPFVALLVLACLGVLVRWRPRDAERLPACLMVIAVFYAFFLMYYVNYSSYRNYGSLLIGLQGRYLFPVIGPIYVLASYYLLSLFKDGNARLGVFLAAVLIFIAFDLPFFLVHATADWFIPIFR
jgi:hypothetical protein